MTTVPTSQWPSSSAGTGANSSTWRTAMSLHNRAMTLIATMEHLYVFDDDDLSTERCSWKMPTWPGRYRGPNKVVGTCNGIICMCDHSGDILLHNPVTRKMLAVPSLPPRHKTGTPVWHQTYRFTRNQATGRYMVVHVPPLSFGQVVVFTLGKASWQDVVIPGATHGSRCNPKDGFVTINNTMYWVVKGKGVKVMSFDLDGKRTPSVIPLRSSRQSGTWYLREVLGRLGVIFSCFRQPMEVWVMVMEGGAGWIHWYIVEVWRPRHQPKWHDNQHLTWPHFATESNHVFTWQWLSTGGGCALYRHIASNEEARRGTVEISQRNQGTIVAHIKTEYDTFQRLDYVETMEPLSVYKWVKTMVYDSATART